MYNIIPSVVLCCYTLMQTYWILLHDDCGVSFVHFMQIIFHPVDSEAEVKKPLRCAVVLFFF